ncbi:bifunctional adenosylcobinamide kinase/adenosylcobinamide-phosphate guanylyltransferase [Hydrogenophilus thermoluteolus]|uniref:Bifunctional adenosylcobalamin biosynthesis protein n=1 Tax=Hydrogenophilus thermoluteolus TaxID=297 RepID=A0A2Z6E0D6_HYDTE|nr:bifunctional adenosylcobinamide kinase/adenosylcobinamide-phosphate guanylyltransferase [Hydrogenophilus thermoluteolus]BBD78213.1 adenosylcobinamide kinase/adenosylcobinamide phosphate guanyltransferase [Hydrogenophilus thermoluteolus]
MPPTPSAQATVHLILGGARSGKSRYAESLAHAAPPPVAYLATAHAGDDEMATRIAHHRAQRPNTWHTIEAPYHLSRALDAALTNANTVVIDCLTLWLSNWLLWWETAWSPPHALPPTPRDASDVTRRAAWEAERAALLENLAKAAPHHTILLVANEVGLGIVPNDPLARHFRDEAGWLNQAVAAVATRVTFVAAGLPLPLKS